MYQGKTKSQGMAAISKDRTIRTVARQGAGCRRSTKGKAEISTARPAADGFLKHHFMSVQFEIHEELKHYRKVERGFFTSLSNLCALYGFASPDVAGQVFPVNLQRAYTYIAVCLKKAAPNVQLIVIQDESHTACLATVREYDTGNWLYYVPINPVLELRKQGKGKQADLLLSVFAYLYQVAGLPSYMDGGSYLLHEYEMIEDWIYDDLSEENTDQLSQILIACYWGKKVLKQMRHPYHLAQFDNRLKTFAPKTAWDSELLAVSRKFMKLYRQFPNRNLFQSVREGLIQPKDEDRVRPEQYASFYWDDRGSLNETLMQVINDQLQECNVMDVPLAVQCFDTPQERQFHDLDFEIRVFDLLPELIDLLNDFYNE